MVQYNAIILRIVVTFADGTTKTVYVLVKR